MHLVHVINLLMLKNAISALCRQLFQQLHTTDPQGGSESQLFSLVLQATVQKPALVIDKL